ncbi:phosphoserine phosphatase SerB [Erythrobacter insulae]|uniref:Phosphoserine phosphatase n=1 Tax=Erythrobacter insulae TaxID=2584124 RepID=A0A547P729_9SPHN|nr:phosphoserine phosphatase SerB [Erythrobacter insulae]TRD09950.1 phosphoserine phosphatase SerB [Erythrobacter insulae]
MADLETRLDAAADAFQTAGMPVISAAMLDFASEALGGEVLQLSFDEGDSAQILAGIDRFFAPTDALVSRSEIAVPQVFVSDMDSTMIGQECIDELADFAGLKAQISEITERAMQGELDFEKALRERVALLAGLDESAIASCLADRITATPGAKTLTATLAAQGTRCVLVTGGFHHFADAVGEELGFHRVVGNRLDVEIGKLTGKLVGGITDATTKAAVLAEEMAKIGVNARSLATGDGANDIPMIEAATYGFAYRAKPKARASANGRVDRGDLSVILALLGIPPKDWVVS